MEKSPNEDQKVGKILYRIEWQREQEVNKTAFWNFAF